MSTTALGTLVPILRDEGQFTPSGRFVQAAGAMGELGPILIVTLLLSTQTNTAGQAFLLGIFVVVTVLTALLSAGAVGRSWRFIESKLKTTGQLPVRLMVLLLFALVVVAVDLGLDLILGAVAAGVITRLVLRDRDVKEIRVETRRRWVRPADPVLLHHQRHEPGPRCPVRQRGRHVEVPLFLGLFLLVRGLPAMLLYVKHLNLREQAPWHSSLRHSCRWSWPSPQSA